MSIQSSPVAVSIYIPTKVQEGLLFPTPYLPFNVCRFSDDGHSDVGGDSFNLFFSNNEQC